MPEKREYKQDPLALARLNVCDKCKHLIYEDEAKRCTLSHKVRIITLINDDHMRCPIEKW